MRQEDSQPLAARTIRKTPLLGLVYLYCRALLISDARGTLERLLSTNVMYREFFCEKDFKDQGSPVEKNPEEKEVPTASSQNRP